MRKFVQHCGGLLLLGLVTLAAAVLFSCEGKGPAETLQGTVRIDGSSTVFPITEAVAEEFRRVRPKVRVTVGVSGTGGGFQKFTTGETDINNASRPIRQSERDAAAAKSIQFMEIAVAFDGLSVMVHPSNDFVTCMTVDELKRLWEPSSAITRWDQIRPEWPEQEIALVGPDTDSGTFDYFTESIVGEEGASRADFTASADDNVLVQGIAGQAYSLGYFGYAYYRVNTERLKLVPIDGGNGCVEPTPETIHSGTYTPLSRPLFIYVNTESLKKQEVREFVQFYLTEGVPLVAEVGYVPLPPADYDEAVRRVKET